MKIIKINENYYCIAKKNSNYCLLVDKFLNLSKVRKNSFAENFFKKMYNSVFAGSLDINEIYTKYYMDEYETFEKYLYQKELLNSKDINRLVKYCKNDKTIYKLNIESNSYNIAQYFKRNEDLIKEFNSIIGGLDK